MYYSNQTLRHKKTNKLVALNPSKKNCSKWNWEISDKTHFIDENGVTFFDDINNYTHINDWLGRPIAGFDRKANKYLDITLKQYLVSAKERQKRYKQELNEWYNWILEELDKKNILQNPFADGNMCWEAYRYFKKKSKAKSLYTKIGKEIYESIEGIPIFKYKNKTWLLEINTIRQIKLNKLC